MAAAQSDQLRIGTTRPRLQRYLAAHVARDRDLGQQSHGARVHRRVPRALRDRRSAQDPRRSRLLASVAGAVLRRRAGQPRRHRQAAGGDAASTASRSPPSILASSAPSTLKQRFLAAGGNADTFKYQCRKGTTSDGIPYVVEFAFGLHQSGLDAAARRVSQVRHRRQLERRRSAIRSALRIHRRRAGEHAGQGAGQRQPAGDLRAASGVGAHPVCGPRQKLDHPRPTTRSSPMTNSRPRNIANDIIDCRRNRDQQMDAAEEIRGAASRQHPLSSLAHDQGAAHDPERGGVGGDGSGLHGRERQRHAASHGAANLLPGAPQDHGDDRG